MERSAIRDLRWHSPRIALRSIRATGLRGYGMKGVSRCALLLSSWSQLRICVKVSGGISVPDNKVKSTQKQSIAYASTNSIAQNE
jgi:hypothetical protein